MPILRIPGCTPSGPPAVTPFLNASLSTSHRRTFSTSVTGGIRRGRGQTFNSGYTNSYDPDQDTTRGPIYDKGNFGVPCFYPRDLKQRIDDYVVGQERAKKMICSVIFNHYRARRRRQSLELQEERSREKAQRQQHNHERDLRSSTFGDEPAGRGEAVRGTHHNPEVSAEDVDDDLYSPENNDAAGHVKIDKSNLLLIGPTGVGKTYILETLSQKLRVPFTISDCNSFTQAGYIGQDVETCVERLLIEANYDVDATEYGIVVLDEFDKVAKKDSSNTRDVGGEGVQQAFLRLVEGTKVTINVKDNRSSRSATPITSNFGPGSTTSASAPQPNRTEQYTIDTTNILFVFCGAFVGLDKVVLKRVSKGSLGFGSEIRTGRDSGYDALPREMYAHLPHQPELLSGHDAAGSTASDDKRMGGGSASGFTPMDLATPADLQAFGFIPELIGRLHNVCALTPLSLDELFRILTEPRNSLVAQYTALFETYPSNLYFTRRALLAIAERAAANETGARGLKMEMERVLAEPMFDAPVHYVLITEACVKGVEKAGYWGKDGRPELLARMDEDDNGPRPTRVAVAPYEQFREVGQSSA